VLILDHLLVIENDVGQPDLLGWNIETINAIVSGRIPDQLVVEPFLLHMQTIPNK